MDTQRMRNKWTEENISYLKISYLQGFPLKKNRGYVEPIRKRHQ
jgi:hypothetical protein